MMYVVGPLSVGRANLKMNDLCGGVPSPGGFLGFVGATARRLGLDGWNVSVLPIIHDLYVHPGRIRPGVKGGPVQPLEVPEDVNGSIVATLLVNLPEEVPEDDVMTAVMSGRLCGGDVLAKDHRIRREGKARIARSEDGEVMRGIPRGYAVIPATETSRLPITNGGDDGLADLLDILHPEDGQRRELGFLIPIAAGYRLIEEPVGAGQRRGVRDVSTQGGPGRFNTARLRRTLDVDRRDGVRPQSAPDVTR